MRPQKVHLDLEILAYTLTLFLFILKTVRSVGVIRGGAESLA